jgi:MoaA/NifB/PqqE/SkfB family radical SAM enzyme
MIPKVHIFDIELTNYCNASCIMCPRSEIKRAKGYMSPEIIEHIIDKINELNISFVIFSGFGEPLLNANVVSYINKIKEETKADIQLNSNGGLLEPPLIDSLLATELNAINLNINATEESTYKNITPGVDFNRLLSHIDYLVSEKKKKNSSMEISIQTTLINENNNEFLEFWFKRGWIKWFSSPVITGGGILKISRSMIAQLLTSLFPGDIALSCFLLPGMGIFFPVHTIFSVITG